MSTKRKREEEEKEEKEQQLYSKKKKENQKEEEEENEETNKLDQEDIQYFQENSNFYNIPFSHEVQLNEHEKMISTLSLDPAGGRLISGSYDYKIKFWDFAGMNSSFKSFRSIEPLEGNQIIHLEFSPTGDRFLLCPGNTQARIYDRDGMKKGECCRGDMYLTDLNHTKGHVAQLNNAQWSTSQKNIFITSAQDGTVRIWDIEKMQHTNKSVMRVKDKSGHKLSISYASYSSDGKIIMAACADGSLQYWDVQGPYTRPKHIFREAHKLGSEITHIQFSKDEHTFITRGMDDSLKIWDLRNFRQCLSSFDDLPNFGHVNSIFSPDEKLILTGTSVRKGQGTGLLVFYDKTLLKRVKQIGVASGSGVTNVLWHPKINQIITGTSSGNIHVMYDPELSTKGALLSIVRKPREKDPNDYEPPRPIIAPNSLPMYYETPGSQRRQAKERFNPTKSAKPIELAMARVDTTRIGPGRLGKLGSSLTQYLMKNHISKDNSRDQDPREALLKYKDADKNPFFFKIYQETQPKTIFDTSEQEEGPVKPDNGPQKSIPGPQKPIPGPQKPTSKK